MPKHATWLTAPWHSVMQLEQTSITFAQVQTGQLTTGTTTTSKPQAQLLQLVSPSTATHLQHLHHLTQLQLPHWQVPRRLWRQRLALHTTAHHTLLQAAAPYADHHVAAALCTCTSPTAQTFSTAAPGGGSSSRCVGACVKVSCT
jgi:hypothetical protein